MKKRIIALCLILSTIANLFFINNVTVVASENNSIDTKRLNYNFIETQDVNNIHYTYEENGQTYHVYEKLDVESSKSHTKIYVVDGNSEKLVEEYTMCLRQIGNATYLNKYINGRLVEKKLIKQSSTANTINNAPTNTRSTTTYNGMIYYEARTNRYFTGWHYAYTDSHYNNVMNLTQTAFAFIVCTSIGVEMGNPKALSLVNSLWKYVIDQKVEVLYWVNEVHQVYQIRYPERTFYGTFIGQRVYTTIYADSCQAIQIGYNESEYRDPEEWPNITIGPA